MNMVEVMRTDRTKDPIIKIKIARNVISEITIFNAFISRINDNDSKTIANSNNHA